MRHVQICYDDEIGAAPGYPLEEKFKEEEPKIAAGKLRAFLGGLPQAQSGERT